MSLSQHFASGKQAQKTSAVRKPVALPADKAPQPTRLRSPLVRDATPYVRGLGALSGFTSAVLLQPLDVVKTRVQQDSRGRVASGIPGVIRAICAREGVAGLWRGTVPTLLRYPPFFLFFSPNFLLFYAFCLGTPAQKRPWASALPDLCAASAECNRTGVPVVCARQGRSGGEADCARQAYPCGEPGRGVRDTDGDRVCDEPSDGRQGAVRGACVRDFHIVQKLVVFRLGPNGIVGRGGGEGGKGE